MRSTETYYKKRMREEEYRDRCEGKKNRETNSNERGKERRWKSLERGRESEYEDNNKQDIKIIMN